MNRRAGLTLIELLVVIAIVGLIIAILLPAIQYAREAARRASCRSHLRQLGVAMHSYESGWTSFPPRFTFGTQIEPGVYGGPWGHNLMLIPYLERRDLYDSFNLGLFWKDSANTTAGSFSPAVFLCPSDATPPRGRYGYANYSGCVGSGLFPGGLDADASDHSAPFDGIFKNPGCKPSDITDGLSQTAAFSERIHGGPYVLSDGSIADAPDPSLGMEYRLDPFAPPTQRQAMKLCDLIGTISTISYAKGLQGTPWFDDTVTYYTHLVTPNRTACLAGELGGHFSPIPASSRHPHLVNVLFADGHVSSISDSIDQTTWRALGSRNGGESVESSY